MRRYLVAVCLCAVTLTAPACDLIHDGPAEPLSVSSTPSATNATAISKDLVPPRNSRSVSAPSGISPAALRHKTCEDLRSRLDRVRHDSGQAGVARAVDETIAAYPSSPDWPVLTGEQRQATIDGTHDAAIGTCPAG
ncbi:hypothetical protein [Nocardia aurantiaca]|uniref:DUF732 domain-containing protein n=1 Tax=Nocardia aurantiaca TaxID=2675850 RepID=A0A6I3L459_9NOCA|nr:hypothetical protein [Nocardia aurantiaca]MTE15730.1 hypothetical protein [Nocardia aurantiaca]